MAATGTPDVPNAMIIAGSIVAVVGVIFLVTIDIAFVMTVAFGVAVALLGVFMSRKSGAESVNGFDSTKKS